MTLAHIGGLPLEEALAALPAAGAALAAWRASLAVRMSGSTTRGADRHGD
jgi:hypothetical protein